MVSRDSLIQPTFLLLVLWMPMGRTPFPKQKGLGGGTEAMAALLSRGQELGDASELSPSSG